MPQPGPVPRDRVTPPRCGRGSVTPSFSCRRRWHRQQHWPHRSQINGGFDRQAAGKVGTTPSMGPGPHVPHTGRASLWACATRAPHLAGRRATSLGLGAATGTSAAFTTFAWLIRVLRWIVCPPVPRIDHEARINHNNRRTSPPGVTPGASCGSCDVQGARGAHTLTLAAMLSRRTGRMVAQLRRSLFRALCAPAPHVRVSPGVCLPPASATGADVTDDAACSGAPVIVDR
jgi:hypothetical protein